MRRREILIVAGLLSLLALTLGACSGGASDIQGIEWQWVSLIETQPAAQSLVPDPENYTILFNEDGTVVIQADCNVVQGTYTASGSKLTIEAGITTLAFCGEDSADNFYLGLLVQVESYELVNETLQLGLAEGAGTMGFVDSATTVSLLTDTDESSFWVDLPEDPTGANLTADVNVNVRSGPGTQFRVIAIATQGDQGETIGTSPDDSWWAVPMPPDHPHYEMAWVAKSATTLSNPDNVDLPPVTPPLLNTVYVEPPGTSDPQATVLERAEVRTGPGAKYPLVGLTSTGVVVKILGNAYNGSWWLIELPKTFLPEGQAWIDNRYLETRNVGGVKEIKDISPVDAQARPTASGMSAAAARVLEPITVRSGPGEDYSGYQDVDQNTIFGIVGVSSDGKWWVVNLPLKTAADKQGWIPVSKTESSKSDAPSPYIPVVGGR